MLILLDTGSRAYILETFNANRDRARTTFLGPTWRHFLRYFATGSTRVEFDMLHVGDEGEEMKIANVAGVDGDEPYWTATEDKMLAIS